MKNVTAKITMARKTTMAKKTSAKKTSAKKASAKKTSAKKTSAKKAKTAAKKATATKKTAKSMKRMTAKPANGAAGTTPSQHIDARIAELGDWRGEMLARIRQLVKDAVPNVVEEWKWRGVPVWYCNGMLCTGETYNSVVKVTFAKGAQLSDPTGLFNSSLDGNVRRAIDVREGEKLDEAAFKNLMLEACAANAP
jgi:hypothetical protein